jgi:transposase-like protein
MAKQKRRMTGTKEEVVLRLLHGEDMELVSRESGFALHELKKWLDQYKRGGREALKSHPGIAADLELDQARQLIAKQALENELLKKARALAEGRRP